MQHVDEVAACMGHMMDEEQVSPCKDMSSGYVKACLGLILLASV